MTGGTEYGKALFMLTEERGTTDAVLPDVKAAEKIFSDNRDYVKLLDTPALSKAEKLALCDGAFSALDEDVRSLIKLLCERHSIHAFRDVAREFSKLYDESRGIEHVEAVTAVAMTDEQIALMKEKLEKQTGKTIIIKNTVSPEILGGVKLRYSGIQLDSSIKTRLERFEHTLKSVVL